jgi:hypothetical protein
MQRPCSIRVLPFGATAVAVYGCLRTGRGFDSRRLHLLSRKSLSQNRLLLYGMRVYFPPPQSFALDNRCRAFDSSKVRALSPLPS